MPSLSFAPPPILGYGITTPQGEAATDPSRGWLPDPAKPMGGALKHGWRRIVEHGYAAVLQDCRGRNGSEGEDHVYGDDAADGYDTLEWIASEPWSDGNVGLSGSSAASTTALAAASQRHPSVKAFFAQVGGSSIYDDVVYEGGSIELERLWLWVANNIPGLSASHRAAVQARTGLSDAEQVFGPQQVLLIAKCYVAAESGADAEAEAESLFELTKDLRDNVRDLAWIRHCLRQRRPEAAESTALRMTSTPAANLVWPYLSLIWRMRQDPRALWLDGAPPFVRSLEVDLAQGEREELAALLRSLHTTQAPYVEQSVRGGTQTERPLFFRTEPIITTVKERLTKAVRDYIDGLPAAVAGHPLLGTPRQEILYAGSWSVRLQRQGFNVAHTHPMGWLSSAFYVALPDKQQMGAPPAGWIKFGPPRADIRLSREPLTRTVKPEPGLLVTFPSYFWHGTLPFHSAQPRLTIAFDAVPL